WGRGAAPSSPRRGLLLQRAPARRGLRPRGAAGAARPARW
nr:hypothetical protein [Tanacetum cinerariifolium]